MRVTSMGLPDLGLKSVTEVWRVWHVTHASRFVTMASNAIQTLQHTSSLPEVHQWGTQRFDGCMYSRIFGWHPSILRLLRGPLGPHLWGVVSPVHHGTICQPKEMQVPHRYSGIPQIHPILQRTTDGPCKGIHNPGLAQTTEGPRCTSFPWLHQLLSKIHPQLLGDNPSPEPPLQKVHHLAFWHRRGKSIPEPKKGIRIHTSTSSLGPSVGGKMVQCISHLWRLVSVIGIHHYYLRMRIPS